MHLISAVLGFIVFNFDLKRFIMIGIKGTSVSIAPRVRTFLGCGPQKSIPPSPKADLEANVLIVEDSNQNQLLIVSIDALYAGKYLRKSLEDAFSETFHPEQIFLAASHSHNSPMLDPTKPLLGSVSVAHLESVANRIVGAISNLLTKESELVSVSQREYVSRKTVFRRRKVPYQVVSRKRIDIWPTLMIPNLNYRARPKAQVLEFRNREGELRSLIWIMPCHPVSHPFAEEASSHFVGYVRAKTRKTYKSMADMPFIFMQGASGDIRPPSIIVQDTTLIQRMLSPGSRKYFSEFTPQRYDSWLDEIYREFENRRVSDNQSSRKVPSEKSTELSYSLVRKDLGDFFQTPDDRHLDVQAISIGGFVFVGVSAEPTWSSSRWLLGRNKGVAIVGCINDTYGYLASPGQYITGGYESKGFHEAFSIKTKTVPLFTGIMLIRWLRKSLRKSLVNVN
jgi:hypothetical protein